jgi:hypothetical protein
VPKLRLSVFRLRTPFFLSACAVRNYVSTTIPILERAARRTAGSLFQKFYLSSKTQLKLEGIGVEVEVLLLVNSIVVG